MTLPLELGGIYDPQIRRALEVLSQQFPVAATGGGGGGAPSGPAGGVLGGTYPNPGFAADMATQAELDTHTALTTTAHGGIVASSDTRLTNARAPTAHATTHQPGGTDAMTVDAAAATGSLRTIGTGALQAAAGNDARLSDARTPTAHTHPAADVVSGVLATARLGSGTPAASTYVDGGTGAWTALPAGGGGTTISPWVAVVSQAADVTNATTTNVNTDLVFAFDANSTYIIDLYLMTTSAATTTGVAFAWDTSVAVTNANLTFEHQLASAGTLTGGDAVADDTVRGLSSGVPDTGTTPIIGMGILQSTTNAGTCRLRFRPEVAASATFKAGSTMRVMKVGGTGGSIPVVTSLPLTPTDGQEVYFVADATNGITWHFRYRSASAAARKWEFIGGPPLIAQVATAETTTSTTFADLTTVGPSLTVPLLGDYIIHHGSILANGTVGQFNAMSYAIGATAASDNDYIIVHESTANHQYSVARQQRKDAIAATSAIVAKYRVSGGTGTFINRWMSVLPVRV